MQIGGLTSYTSSAPVLNPVHFARSSSAVSAVSATSATSSSSASSASTAAQATASTGSAAPAKSSKGGGASGGGAGGGGNVVAETMAATFSTSVGGKQYSGSVEKSGTEYSASVGNLAGASASGSSIQSAENNLTMKIDVLA